MTTSLVPTKPTRERFSQAFNRLAASFNASVDVAKMQVYYDALRGLPIEAVEAAAVWLAKHGGEFFPSSATWFARAEAIRGDMVRAIVHQARPEPWRYDCTACEDTGFELFRCLGRNSDVPPRWSTAAKDAPERQCPREFDHAPHTYVTECLCRPTNRTYQRERERRQLARKSQR